MNTDDATHLSAALTDFYPGEEVHVVMQDYGNRLTVTVGKTVVCTPKNMSARALDWREWLHRIQEIVPRGQRPS